MRVQIAAVKATPGVVNVKCIPLKLKAQSYRTMECPTMFSGAETWVIKSRHFQWLQVFEIRCFHTIRGVTRRKIFQNESIRMKVQVQDVSDKIQETWLC